MTKKWDADKLRRQVQAEAEIVAAFGQQAGAAIERHAEQKRAELRQQIKATEDPEKIKALQAQINEINTQERLLNVAVARWAARAAWRRCKRVCRRRPTACGGTRSRTRRSSRE
ncbi:hypothetical protein AL520_21805 [Achromobacter xylosoxidans]|nr:hypothetical protein AL520_21805 [Achromobacter xylosoxidans]